MQTIRPDPVITEVRAIRDDYAARFDYDVGKDVPDLQDRQNASGRKYVCYPARRPSIDLNGPQAKVRERPVANYRQRDGEAVSSWLR